MPSAQQNNFLHSVLSINRWVFLALIGLSFIEFSPLREIVGFITMFTFISWMYAAAILGQQQLLKSGIKTDNTALFKAAVFASPLLILISFFFNPVWLEPLNIVGILLITLLVLSTIGSMLFIYYFTTKTITKLEKNRTVHLKELRNNFFLISFLGVGIFFLQPKLQRLLEHDNPAV